MGNNDILIPGMPEEMEEPTPLVTPSGYLEILDALSDISENGLSLDARSYLDVYSTDDVNIKITDEINRLHNHLKSKIMDLGSIVSSNLSINLNNYDQLTSDLDMLSKKEDTNASKITNLNNDLKNKYYTKSDTDKEITKRLSTYVEKDEVYEKDTIYTKLDIDKLFRGYIKADGSTKFTGPQEGVYPRFRKELATKGYADDCMKNHKNEADPHNFITKLNDKLNNYYKKSEVFTKALTYDRSTLDNMVDKLVKQACSSLIEEHINITPHLTSLEVLQLIKLYALENLLSKDTYNNSADALKESIESKLVWKTSGPVETTVGFVEDNSEVPDEMTLQDIMDAIFYGKGISITIHDNVNMGDSCDITVCIHGSLVLVDRAELYQNGKLIKTYDPEDFEEGCITESIDNILEDTTFDFKVYYTDGSELEESKTVKCLSPIFIGSMPFYTTAGNITWEYLEELEKNNFGVFTSDTSYKYNFIDPLLRELFIVVPKDFPELKSMISGSQNFGIEAFDIINTIYTISKIDIPYRVYIYKQAISSINLTITFNFSEE